jgi:hypothetical protein
MKSKNKHTVWNQQVTGIAIALATRVVTAPAPRSHCEWEAAHYLSPTIAQYARVPVRNVARPNGWILNLNQYLRPVGNISKSRRFECCPTQPNAQGGPVADLGFDN